MGRASLRILACTLLAGTVCAGAQSSIAISTPAGPLLPQSFGTWKHAATAAAPSVGYSLANENKQALEECGPQRSAVADYTSAGRTLHLEAIQFGDRTGAYSCFTLVERPSARESREAGVEIATAQGGALLITGDSLVLASPATEADLPALRELAKVLPKPTGNQGVAPLLPSLLLQDHLIPGSIRYALGPASYAAEGGVLPANSLDWEKSAEAVMAAYQMKQGRETLTLLLYPTPQIASAITKRISAALPGLGSSFSTAGVRRENELVALASGPLPADAAQRMVGQVHLSQLATTDRYMPPVFHDEVQKTYSLLTNIAVLSGVLMAAAVLLGLFLGGGRAAVRVLRGKPAASEAEFLSLHLSPQNAAPSFDSSGSGAPS
jgi:hypothetical protein